MFSCQNDRRIFFIHKSETAFPRKTACCKNQPQRTRCRCCIRRNIRRSCAYRRNPMHRAAFLLPVCHMGFQGTPFRIFAFCIGTPQVFRMALRRSCRTSTCLPRLYRLTKARGRMRMYHRCAASAPYNCRYGVIGRAYVRLGVVIPLSALVN